MIRFLFQFNKQKPKYLLPDQLSHIKNGIRRRGLYLFSGPVGSGKTTLMYKLAKGFKGQVITIEDPVEIEEPTFLQLQTNPKINQSYDTLIRLSLRHRPDVLIVGEIRDSVTAQAAIRAALTGHYVFATVHARDLSSVKGRLLELGRNQAEIEDCLQGIIYQEMFFVREEAQVLCAYQFFSENQSIETFTMEEGLKTAKEKYSDKFVE